MFASLAVKATRFFFLQVILLSAFYFPFLNGEASFFFEDITHFFEPLCRFLGDSFRHGHLPLWNPYNYCGMSQAAISSPGIFYPPNLVFAILPFNSALATLMIFSQCLAGLGVFLLVMSLSWGELAAITGGVIVAFSGYMFSFSNNYTLVSAASWLPLLFFSFRSIKPSSAASTVASWTIFSAALIGLMICSGRPEIWVPGFVCVFVFCLGLIMEENTNVLRLSKAFSFLRAAILGVLLSMPSLLPTLEWAPLSRRSEGLDPGEILMFSSSWYDLLSLFVSQSLGDLQLRFSELRCLVQAKNLVPYLSSAFISIFTAILALLGMQRRGGFFFYVSIAGIIVFAFLSLGSNVPFADFFVKFIPGASILRFPSKLLFFVGLGFAILAARGMRNFLQSGMQSVVPEILFLTSSIASLALKFSPVVLLPFLYWPTATPALCLQAQDKIAISLLSASVLALLLLGLMRLLDRFQKRQIAGLIAIGACTVALLLNAYQYCRYAAPSDFFKQESPLAKVISSTGRQSTAQGVAALGTPRVLPLFLQKFTVPEQYNTPDRLASTIRTYQYSRQVLRPFTNCDAGVSESLGFEGSMVGEYYYFALNTYARSNQYVPLSADDHPNGNGSASDIPLARLAQLTSCSLIATQIWRDNTQFGKRHAYVPLLDQAFFEKEFEQKDLNVRLYKLKNPMPRAYLSYAWKAFDAREDLLTQVYDAEKTKWSPEEYSMLESFQNGPADKLPASSEEDAAAIMASLIEEVAVIETQPEDLKLQFQSSKPCLLVLCDQFYPGWKATLDSENVELLRCNGFMRAIYVAEPGPHKVRFSYEPDSVKFGLLFALVSLIWCVVILVQSRSVKQAENVEEPSLNSSGARKGDL